MAMLTPERLSEVTWTLEKIDDAQDAIERLIAGEPHHQPPTDRTVALRKIELALDDCAEQLRALFD